MISYYMDINFTIAGSEHSFKFSVSVGAIGIQQKKELRLCIASALPRGLVPFHAALLRRHGRGILIVGASGAGKTTLAEALCSKEGSIVARDMVVAWRDGSRICAGDLNFREENAHKTALPIDEVIFLSPSDPRDFFNPNLKEARSLYSASLPSFERTQVAAYTHEDVFSDLVHKSVVLGNRQSVQRWQAAFVHKDKKFSRIRVGIIGLGAIGQEVANLLMSFSHMESLHVYSPDAHKLAGVILDLQSVGAQAIYHHSTVAELVSQCDILVCSFGLRTVRAPYHNGGERMSKFLDHGDIVWNISRAIREERFRGVVLMVTNPIDSLALALYRFSNSDDKGALDWNGLYNQQVLGIGLGLDFARLTTITHEKFEVVGEHSDGVILCQLHGNTLVPVESMGIQTNLASFSSRIRQHILRTKFGPAHEIMRVVQSICCDGSSIMRVSFMDHTGIFFGDIFERRDNGMRRCYNSSSLLEHALEKQRTRQRRYYADLLSYILHKNKTDSKNNVYAGSERDNAYFSHSFTSEKFRAV